ncbi:hypothetical protein MPSEU_000313300 [Mayamaea pseudoterrestris]|nr:hypothetical protein MPSEU_000313300 [Mayamaea pseudoterrestris]
MGVNHRKRRRTWSSAIACCYTTIYSSWTTIIVHASSDSTVTKGSLDVQSTCNANKVKVRKFILLCDSPGAYYYGSNTYRNSRVCMSNDKANIQINFTISERYKGNGNVRVTLQAGIYNTYTTILDNVRVCQLGVAGDNAYKCPKPGDYVLKTYFYVPAIRDYDFHYTPDVKLTFMDGDGQDDSILGCSATGTMALHTRATRKAQRGLLALGLCTFSFLLVFGGLLCASYRRKKEIQKYLHELKTSRYYIQTMPNGNVVVNDTDEEYEEQQTGLPHSSVRLKANEHSSQYHGNLQHQLHDQTPTNMAALHYDTDDDARRMLDIRNPIHNESQVPMRPVI